MVIVLSMFRQVVTEGEPVELKLDSEQKIYSQPDNINQLWGLCTPILWPVYADRLFAVLGLEPRIPDIRYVVVDVRCDNHYRTQHLLKTSPLLKIVCSVARICMCMCIRMLGLRRVLDRIHTEAAGSRHEHLLSFNVRHGVK